MEGNVHLRYVTAENVPFDYRAHRYSLSGSSLGSFRTSINTIVEKYMEDRYTAGSKVLPPLRVNVVARIRDASGPIAVISDPLVVRYVQRSIPRR